VDENGYLVEFLGGYRRFHVARSSELVTRNVPYIGEPARQSCPRSFSHFATARGPARDSQAASTKPASSSRLSSQTREPRRRTEGCPSKWGVVKKGSDASARMASFSSSDSTQKT